MFCAASDVASAEVVDFSVLHVVENGVADAGELFGEFSVGCDIGVGEELPASTAVVASPDSDGGGGLLRRGAEIVQFVSGGGQSEGGVTEVLDGECHGGVAEDAGRGVVHIARRAEILGEAHVIDIELALNGKHHPRGGGRGDINSFTVVLLCQHVVCIAHHACSPDITLVAGVLSVVGEISGEGGVVDEIGGFHANLV